MFNTLTRVEKEEQEVKEEQLILATNAWHLARYVIEHDHEIEIPEDFNTGQFICWSEDYPNISPENKIKFINQYAELEKLTENVTARTLVATRIHGRGLYHAVVQTSVGQYLTCLTIFTALFVFMLVKNFNDPGNIMLPFYAAGLGTCVFLLRVTQEKLKSREFDPAFIPSQLIRLTLGMLAGGSVVLFPDLISAGVGTAAQITVENGAAKPEIKIEMGQMALAFLLGYAVDIFYALLDNIGGKVKKQSVPTAK